MSFWQKKCITFGYFFSKNAFNPHINSIFSRFFAQKYSSKYVFFFFFKNAVQLRATRRNLRFFIFFYNKITLVYCLFFEKKKQKNATGGKKVGKKSSTRIYTGISTFFCPKPLLQNHAQYPIFCIFFQKY